MAWFKLGPGKSGAREVSFSILCFWFFITARHFMWVSLEAHAAQENAWEVLSFVSLPIVAAGFGLDKVLTYLRRPGTVPKGAT